jgi:hypothetical protein
VCYGILHLAHKEDRAPIGEEKKEKVNKHVRGLDAADTVVRLGLYKYSKVPVYQCQVGCLQSEEAATWVVVGSLVGSSIGVRAQYH